MDPVLNEQSIAVDLWREVGRHLALAEILEALAVFLRTRMALAHLTVWHLDGAQLALAPLASSQAGPLMYPSTQSVTLSKAGHRTLREWLASHPVSFPGRDMALPALLAPLMQPTSKSATALLTMTDLQHKPCGVVVAVFSHNVVSERSRRLLAQAREPLAAALQNELRHRAMDALRASADAERQSLLHRMGRESLDNVIVGASEGLKLVLQRVDQVARVDASVLLLGETGSGKEVVARAIHERSSRAHCPILRVNCGAVPQELIDSELFGHEKGSFTGAGNQRRGWFERADGGTLFLDEIGELPLAAQVRFLRVLQEGVLFRVGGEQLVKVNVRIIAATHRDLAAMVSRGEFREDLWYRIAVFPILIPALRERQQDIPALAHHFAQRAAVKLGLPQRLPNDDDIALLRTYDWPGNVREMATVIERAALLGEGRRLAIAAALGLATTRTHQQSNSSILLTLDQVMAQHIKLALETTQGRIEGAHGAAKMLGINHNTLRSRMRKLGISRFKLP